MRTEMSGEEARGEVVAAARAVADDEIDRIGTSLPVVPSAVLPSTSGGPSGRRMSAIDFTGASARTIRR